MATNHKSCKCTKSKCLQLYCKCFASSFFCAEGCGCQGCLNQKVYELEVEMACEKIIARDPLAFAPKINPIVQSPSHNEGGDQLIAIAGKHRKGCTCKKSTCSQDYCACYKARVGCSDGCQCNGCKNTYGKRGEYNVHNAPHIMRAIINEKPNDCGKKVSEFPILEFSSGECHHYKLPSLFCCKPFQYSDHEIVPSLTESYSPPPPSPNTDMIGTSIREFGIVPLDQQMYPYGNQIMDNQFTYQDVNEMMDLIADDTLIYTTDNTTQLNLPSEPSLPSSSTGGETSPDDDKWIDDLLYEFFETQHKVDITIW